MKNGFDGITVLGLFFFLLCITGFWGAIINPLAGNVLLFSYSAIFSLLMAIIGVGLFRRKNWARVAALIVITFKMLQVFIWGMRDSYFMLQNAPQSKTALVLFGIGTTLLFTSIYAGILFYLLRARVTGQFS